MKILHALPSVDPKGGGPVEAVRQLGLALHARGHTAEVVCLDAPDAPWLADFPLKVHALGPAKGHYRYSPTFTPWMKSNAPKFDAVIVDGLWQYNGFGTWRALRSSRTPYYVFTHGMLGPWFKRTYPLKHLKKWLYWPWADYRLLRDARCVLFTCEEERRQARQSFWLYRCTEKVVPFGTSQPPQDASSLRSAFLAKHPHLAGQRLLLFLGRIHTVKGCDLLVKAFCDLAPGQPDLHLVLVGADVDGLTPEFLALARSKGLGGRVSWLGMLSGDDKWGAFHACSAFALPSHHENFGIAVVEAMACAKPVLISDQVNIWREIDEGGGGFVAPDTVEGTRQNLKRWLALSLEESDAMGRKAQATYKARFTVDAMADAIVDLIRKGEASDFTLRRQGNPEL